jgi:hypothetical protein
MSQQYDNTNRGALFVNDKAGNDKRPDLKGPLNIEGTEYIVSAWARKTKDGEKMLSLRVEPKKARETPPPVQDDPPADTTDNLPF